MKKRIFALFLIVLMLFSLLSCSSSIQISKTSETAHQKESEEKTETEEMKETGDIILPQGFSVGYAKKAVNPDEGVGLAGFSNVGSRLSKVILDDIMITCTALSDGEKVFLILCFDTAAIDEVITNSVTKRLGKMFSGLEIPAENIFLNATHTHSAPAVHREDAPGIGLYMKKFYPALYEVAERALRDLSLSTIEYSTTNTEGLNYVRRYVTLDGTKYLGGSALDTGLDPEEVRHETQPDTQLQLLRFKREEGKDVVLCNWQCHPCSFRIGTESGTSVSSEWCGVMRKEVEKNLGVNFAYLQGAAGNLVSTTKIRGEKDNPDYTKKGKELAEVVEKALENTTRLGSGAFQALRKEMTYNLEKGKNHDKTLYLSALTIGEVAFATVPCELHDTLGVQVKEESPFKVTFMCGYTNGHHGYVPASFAFENGGYEVESTYYERGTGEKIVEDLLTLLREINSLCTKG